MRFLKRPLQPLHRLNGGLPHHTAEFSSPASSALTREVRINNTANDTTIIFFIYIKELKALK